MRTDTERVLVSFLVEKEGKIFHERMYALPMGGSLFCLDNSPFHFYGVSFGDIVFAPPVDGVATYKRTVSRRGHSTYRVKLARGRNHDDFLARWAAFRSLGCSFEGSSMDSTRLYAIDVPPRTDIRDVYRLLEVGEKIGDWVFEEASYCPDDPQCSGDH